MRLPPRLPLTPEEGVVAGLSLAFVCDLMLSPGAPLVGRLWWPMLLVVTMALVRRRSFVSILMPAAALGAANGVVISLGLSLWGPHRWEGLMMGIVFGAVLGAIAGPVISAVALPIVLVARRAKERPSEDGPDAVALVSVSTGLVMTAPSAVGALLHHAASRSLSVVPLVCAAGWLVHRRWRRRRFVAAVRKGRVPGWTVGPLGSRDPRGLLAIAGGPVLDAVLERDAAPTTYRATRDPPSLAPTLVEHVELGGCELSLVRYFEGHALGYLQMLALSGGFLLICLLGWSRVLHGPSV